jgi:glycosyltransferase involved in cell wall biosynthesis
MKFILVIDKIESGGAEKILLDFRKYLVLRGHVVRIFVLYSNNNEYVKGCRRNSSNPLIKLLQQIIIYVKLLRFVRAVNPDYIYSFLDRSNVLTALLPKKYNRCLSVHNVLSIQYAKLGRLSRQLTSYIIKRTYNRNNNLVLAVSDIVASDLCVNFSIDKKRLCVITNCCDKQTVEMLGTEEVTEYTFDRNYKYIINIGRLTTQKAQWKLFKAIRYIYTHNINANIKLVVLGEGELKDELNRLSQTLGIEQFVDILPFNKNPYKFIVNSDLLVLPSIFEGFPIVISEAAALNCPFIGSDKAIPSEIFSKREVWRDCTYSNIYMTPDFSDTIYDDDIALAKLIMKFVKSDVAQQHIISGYSIWNMQNDKDRQFDQYLQLFGRE